MSTDTQTQSIPVAMGRPRTEAETETENGSHLRAPVDEASRSQSQSQPRPYHTPLIDIHEGPDGLVLEADLPGASDNNLSIQLEDNVLTMHARVPSTLPEGARALHEEYRTADYFRSFILSDEVERSKITAELKNGVLRLNLPKAERAKTRRIEIRS
jgi:HSP20 family molecular chaperone IbpA